MEINVHSEPSMSDTAGKHESKLPRLARSRVEEAAQTLWAQNGSEKLVCL